MRQKLSLLLLIGLTAIVVGCKLAVIVVEGGDVESDRNGVCGIKSVCIIDVPDTSFQDVFVPRAQDGWYFDSWKYGHKFLCGGSINPVCELSFAGLEEELEDIVATSETFYLMPEFRPIQPGTVVVNGRTVIAADRAWLQPVDFVGYSFNQVNEVCPEGACSGTLPGSTIDLTGYVWASTDDVRLLFQAYRKAGRDLLEDFEHTWIREFPTGSAPGLDAIVSNQYIVVVISDVGGEFYPLESYPAPLNTVGVWFWRDLE